MMKKFIILALLVVACSSGPELVDDRVKFVEIPDNVVPGSTYEFFWEVSGGAYVSSTSIQVSSSDDFSDYRSSAIQTNGPGVYKGNIVVEDDDSFLRIHANLDGEDLYSEVLSVG